MSEEKRVRCEVYSRVVGYFRPVCNWHKAKQQEFADRRVFTSAGSDKIGEMAETDKGAR